MNAALLRDLLARLDNALDKPSKICIYGSGALMLLGEEDRFSVDIDVADVSGHVRDTVDGISGAFVAVQPRAGHWTPNKQWPIEQWREVIRELVEEVDVVELGGESVFEEPPGGRFHDLTGRTSLTDVSHIMSQAVVFAGLPSSGMHFAAMWGVPSVVVFSGYESPAGYDYPFFRVFHDPPECAPCWLTTPCPHDLKCLNGIKATEIAAAVREAVNREG